MVSSDLIQQLYEIANIKRFMPARASTFFSELGLYVQMRETSGMARLQAGGRFRSRIDLWRESHTDPWQVKKYRTGDWERLVEPTHRLAHWLGVREAVTLAVRADFEYAVRTFRSTGELELPERLDSIPDDSILGRLLEPYSEAHGSWDEAKGLDAERELLRYLEVNPGHASAWQALMRTYRHLDRYSKSLAAINEAIRLAPYEAEFHREAAFIYVTALKNAVDPDLQLGLLGRAMMDCTLKALECSYQDARVSCVRHLGTVLESKRPDSERLKREARWMFDWCAGSPTHNPDCGET